MFTIVQEDLAGRTRLVSKRLRKTKLIPERPRYNMITNEDFSMSELLIKIITLAFLTCFQCLIQKELTHQATEVSSLFN